MKNTKKVVERMLGLGGSIGQAAGAATSLIPGVGPIISPILTPILEGLGNAIDNRHQDENHTKLEEARNAINPLGYFLDGGKTKTSLKVTHGGFLQELADDVYVSKGRTHKEGGIKGDTNNDGSPEIEFEDKELYFDFGDKGGFFVNKETSSKYASSFSKRNDKVGNDTNNILKAMAIKENELKRGSKIAESLMKDGGHFIFYDGGGPTAHNPMGSINTNYSIPFEPISFQDVWNGFIIRNTASYNPDAMVRLDPIQGTPSITPGTDGGYGRIRATQGKATDYTTYSKDGNSAATAGDQNSTLGDKLILAGQMVPVAYNLARGLMDKAEVVKPNYHPYEDNVIGLMKSRSYNPQTVQNQIDYTTAAGKSNIAENTNSSSVARSNMQKLFDNAANAKANADLHGQEMNNSYKADLASTYDAMGRLRVDAENWATQQTNANKVAKDNYILTGVTQFGSALNTFGESQNTSKTNSILNNILGDMMGIYTIDANGKIIFKQ